MELVSTFPGKAGGRGVVVKIIADAVERENLLVCKTFSTSLPFDEKGLKIKVLPIIQGGLEMLF